MGGSELGPPNKAADPAAGHAADPAAGQPAGPAQAAGAAVGAQAASAAVGAQAAGAAVGAQAAAPVDDEENEENEVGSKWEYLGKILEKGLQENYRTFDDTY